MDRETAVDVVVVGTGIAGGALSAAIASEGFSVVALERSTEYKDRVRGEFIAPWGVAEAQRLGLFQLLLAAGANVMNRMYGYDEVFSTEEAQRRAVALDALVEGVPGALGIGHPAACAAIASAAQASGARIIRGVADVAVEPGVKPVVRYTLAADTGGRNVHEVPCRIVIGADGRDSAVRQSVGMRLQATQPRVFLGGLLVDGVGGWDSACALIGTEHDRMFYAFPQSASRSRLYLGVRAEERQRLSGADRVATLLEGFQISCLPSNVDIASAVPVGPCAAYPMQDTWTDTPCADGVVLVGDAAGYSDPVIGQGLSIGLRDARSVSEVLLAGDDWSTTAFRRYVQERAERMRRLRFAAQLFTDAHLPARPGETHRRARMDLIGGGDERAFLAQVCTLTGPETAPAGCFDPAVRSRLLAAV